MRIRLCAGLCALILGLIGILSSPAPTMAQEASIITRQQSCDQLHTSPGIQQHIKAIEQDGDYFVIIPDGPPIDEPPVQPQGLVFSSINLFCAANQSASTAFKVTFGPTSSSFQTSLGNNIEPNAGFCSAASCTVLHGMSTLPGETVFTHTAYGAFIWDHNGVCF
jgi:hypothetical protein